MARTKQRLWRVELKPYMGGTNTSYITTKSSNLVILAREIEKLIAKVQVDYTSTLEFQGVYYIGIVGE